MDLSPQDAFTLRRAMARMPIDPAQCSPGISLMLRGFNLLTDDGYQRFSQVVTSDTDLLVQVMRLDPNQPPVAAAAPAAQEPVAFVPPLPDAARLSDSALKAAESVGTWYRLTSDWCKKRSPMTPPHFLEGAIIWLIGLAIGRRLCLVLHERIYPHLYLLIVAETSRYAKSTGMSVIHSLIGATMPYMLVPGSATTEAMMEILSGQLPANYDKLPPVQQRLIESGRQYAGQRGIMLDEYSSLLGSSKKDYMQGFVELLMRLYDARETEQYYTRSGGLLTINRPGISIFGATTPAAMARSLNNEAWQNGEMARYLILFREGLLPYDDSYGKVDIPGEITAPLMTLHNTLPRMKNELIEDAENFQPMTALMTEEANTAYRAYSKAVRYDLIDETDARLHGNYTRMSAQAVKIALSLAAMDYLGSGEHYVRIELGHWALAQEIVEHARRNLHNLMLSLNETRDSRNQQELLTLLRQNPGGLTVRDFCRRMGAYSDDIRRALDILVESGETEEVEHHPTTGRPTKFYRLISTPN